MPDIIITIEEEKAIKSLERLAKKWPDTLQLFSWSGELHIFKLDDAGVFCDVPGFHIPIPNDGGDPEAVNQDAKVIFESEQ